MSPGPRFRRGASGGAGKRIGAPADSFPSCMSWVRFPSPAPRLSPFRAAGFAAGFANYVLFSALLSCWMIAVMAALLSTERRMIQHGVRVAGGHHGADRTKHEKLQQTFQSDSAALIAGAL